MMQHLRAACFYPQVPQCLKLQLSAPVASKASESLTKQPRRSPCSEAYLSGWIPRRRGQTVDHQDLMNWSRSTLICSECVVAMP
ncbi:hypothetical protein R69608_03245 [Paraburkholderia nemoris]|nr:hypothetical protein R69608_03245 [Paraburkholderia nemoris]